MQSISTPRNGILLLILISCVKLRTELFWKVSCIELISFYFNKFKTSNLIISNNSSPSTELLDRINIIYMFKCPLGDCVSNENNIYVGLTTTTLSRQFTMHLNDSSSIALHIKIHSILKSKFKKILVKTPL